MTYEEIVAKIEGAESFLLPRLEKSRTEKVSV